MNKKLRLMLADKQFLISFIVSTLLIGTLCITLLIFNISKLNSFDDYSNIIMICISLILLASLVGFWKQNKIILYLYLMVYAVLSIGLIISVFFNPRPHWSLNFFLAGLSVYLILSIYKIIVRNDEKQFQDIINKYKKVENNSTDEKN